LQNLSCVYLAQCKETFSSHLLQFTFFVNGSLFSIFGLCPFGFLVVVSASTKTGFGSSIGFGSSTGCSFFLAPQQVAQLVLIMLVQLLGMQQEVL
jgi:hypothetical protein